MLPLKMGVRKIVSGYRFLIIIILISSVLMLLNLGDRGLVTDEAHTSTIALNALKFGYPKVYDGVNIIADPIIYEDQHLTKEYLLERGKEISKLYPWMQYYAAAFGFVLFGKNNFAARFPFAVLGLASVLLTYLLAHKITRNKKSAYLSAILLAAYVPFYLYSRQCRYFALTIFFSLLVIYYYINFLEGRKNSLLYFTIFNILSFHSFYISFFSVFISIAIHFLLFEFNKNRLIRLILSSSIIILFTVPWLFLMDIASRLGKFSLYSVLFSVVYVSSYFLLYAFPLIFCFLLPFLMIKKKKFSLDNRMSLILIIIIVSLFVNSSAPFDLPAFRYLTYLFPLFMILSAKIFLWIKKYSRCLAAILFILFISTNYLFIAPFKPFENLMLNKADKNSEGFYFIKDNLQPRYLLLDYLYEITHHYDGPSEKIISFLNKNSKKGEIILCNGGSPMYAFYTDLIIYRSDLNKSPDWIIARKPYSLGGGAGKQNYDYVLSKANSSYELIIINSTDYLYWLDTPHPRTHRFKENKELKTSDVYPYETYPIEIYHLRK